MPDGSVVTQMINDPDFGKMPLSEQRRTLSRADSDFGKMGDGDFVRFVQGAKRTKAPSSPVANQAFIRARNSMPAPPNAILADQPKTSGGQLGQDIGDTATAVNTKLANIPSGIGSMIGSVASAKSPEDFMKNQMVNMAQSYVQDSAKAQRQGGPQTPLPLFGAAQTLGIDPSAVRESALNNDASSLTAETAGPIAQIMAAKGIARGGAELAGKDITVNPNTLYHRYLDPVAATPAEMPKMTPRMSRALTNRIQINHPEIAARIEAGTTTLGDLDKIRQVAGKAAESAVNAQGKPTEMAEGYLNVSRDVRSVLYPKIEAMHGLPEGTLQSLKLSEGRLIATKPPFGANADVIDAGSQLVNPMKWPRIAERIAKTTARYGYEGAKTAAKSVKLPNP